MNGGLGVPVVAYRRGEPLYSKAHVDINTVLAIETEESNFFEGRVRGMSADVRNATEKTLAVVKEFSGSIERLVAIEESFVEHSKRASGRVRDSAERLAQGLARVEKSANFDRLGEYVSLLERAAKAMETLAALEASGKLEKIATAIR